MANSNAVWGIEIGQSALKALRCRLEGDEIVADAFDFIEYPKILSQPEAEPEELIREALRKFLERNETRGDRIAMSVPGQTGLAKFFKPPPVEAKKIGDIVKYEARQQIPFDLEDVVWDYQMMPGSTIEDGYALETEIGLFAMKREQAYRQLSPFDDVGLEVDLIQLAPLAMYNMLAYDRMHERLDGGRFDAENPPPSSVMLALGTDSTDLIVTNGFRIWQRSMPLGGNHFTRQLTKDLKLTFAKAEHLKRNARQAEDPKLVFQTMRPVFNDLVTEVQRSVGFFKSINKKASIEQLLLAGNTVKLPGLSAYLGKNLGYEVHTLDHFERLGGTEVIGAPAFKDNIYSYGVCYGLCLQALGRGPLTTSLVPQEILTERMIRAKKPWALAAVAALLVGLAGYYGMAQRSWAKVHPELWAGAQAAVQQTKTYSDSKKDVDSKQLAQLTYLKQVGEEVSGNVERRLLWLELLKAIHQSLPRTELVDGEMPSVKQLPLDERDDIYITSIDTQRVEDVKASWFTPSVQEKYKKELQDWSRVTGKPLPEDFADDPGPEGEGWIITLTGYHYHNHPTKHRGNEGGVYVRRTLMDELLDGTVQLPLSDGTTEVFTMRELGISYPFLLADPSPVKTKVPNPDYEPPASGAGYGGMEGMMPGMGGMDMLGMAPEPGMEGFGPYGGAPGGRGANGKKDDEELVSPTLEVRKFSFEFQFFWQEKPRSVRLEEKRAREAAEAEAAEAEGEADPASGDTMAMNVGP
ncbi:type IV pilus assembly protein PilM [Candidatus Laterigemmans baculatus]|uniref:type IV pilus assembly protein PilM n=1 Tax=Candidatus Laterigemmans baculatus TaxID=2770505 RepID=UPI0013DA3DAC|nr:type IV pilus assembly protein PilM [Candidatus Laterigemmans baculatus]